MNKEYSLADFDKTIRELGGIYCKWVQSQLAPTAWRRATLEVRYAQDGSYWDDKMQVETDDCQLVSLDTTQPIRAILGTLNEMRHVLGWYSFKMDVDSNGNVVVSYGYDPNSVEDSSFFED